MTSPASGLASDPVQPAARGPGRGRRLIKRVMIWLLVIYLVWLVIGFSIQRLILFPSSMAVGQGPLPADAELLTVEIGGGKVEAWFIPGEGVSGETPGPVVIFAHGNAELIDHWPDMLRGYMRRGVSVLLPEFRGYGRSAGKPGQAGIVEDYAAFYDQVIGRPGVDAGRVVIHGRSIGGGVAAQLANDRPSAALIFQSSPASIKRMAARFLFPWFLVRDPFDSVRVVKAYERPVLVMHGRLDGIVPPSHAERLADAATHEQSRLIWYDVDHNTLPPEDAYWRDIEAFLKDADVLD